VTRSSTIKGGALTSSDLQGDFAASDNRREHERCPSAKVIAILPCRADSDGWAFRPVELTDCSLQGLGFCTDQPMKQGEQFLAKLRLDRTMLVLYTVRHCQLSGRNQFRIGATVSEIIGASGKADHSKLIDEILASND
jgi:hypothetical protein